ncbi:MAG: ATP-binding protein [bacterium]|nr:ATP-binding protein [bacterium]
MVTRERHLKRLEGLLQRHPVVAVVGARQVGKTTLALELSRRFGGTAVTFDLENPAHVARLEDPMLALEGLEGLVAIDEIQNRPELFPVLRVLADRPGTPARFLVLGSASPHLLRQSSESLAGRIAYYELDGFMVDEVGPVRLQDLWLRGRFPRSFLAASDAESAEWRRDFVGTFLERDLPQLASSLPPATLRRFWTMLAHVHGQNWNASDFARSFGVSDTTVRRYLDQLTSTFMVHQLQPWHENLRKRQVKAPRIFLADSGLLHTLLNLENLDDVLSHPKVGASWEGFALSVVTARLGARRDEIYFWATHAGAEIDLVVVRGRRRLGFEFKRTVAPKVTKSMRIALSDLRLDRIDVVHAGAETFQLAEDVRAVGLGRVWEDLEPL